MELAKRDKQIDYSETLNKQIDRNLNEKHKQLLKSQHDNDYLRDVVELYNSHVNNIQQQNVQQYKALQGVIDYLRKMTLEPTVTQEIEQMIRADIKIILDEMKTIMK